ncbi:tRNA adenosine(34) deaminase TadA [Paramaledivibacter caminithermalis]|jgi:tRNA(adenine34) deaminase|uniref:tRNA-specific adenosine deaminase n=1 Tax=Paramaledivibacter caminithermalis (strain DSM 15212 / CIP 107654 / DViRD3) TaxID=1121301 RepID=A0A1M6TQH9_PARC5|nr:tRNA adenosine(34) deaminase TadA [Paramaledivibacter caminithermalis]SHK59197.1 tRNA(adenine34) deaminase [Paramaledivibacter caminithermalis DSM 15212]
MKEFFMEEALKEAKKAFDIKEIPIGAVIVRHNEIIARGHNLRESTKDPTAHAEIIAIRRASEALGGWRLTNCDLYVTIEPCPMCAGAIVMARISRLFIGSMDPKGGAAGSLYNIVDDSRLNHRTEIIYNVLSDKCSGIMKEFFKKLRER